MIQKMAIAAVVSFTALVTVLGGMNMPGSVYASSNGEAHAPGQHDIHQNPSDHDDSSSGYQPPGHGEDQNPGQCQDFFQHGGFEFDKDTAHDICHGHQLP
jgi:hypothetical protein